MFDGDVKKTAERIEGALQAAGNGRFRSEEDVDSIGTDVDAISNRYSELKSTMDFSEASRQARLEFIERVLNEETT